MSEPSELEKVKLVGGYVPQPLADKLSVLALYYDQTRSDIIRSLIERQLAEEPPVAQLLDVIAQRLYQSWCQTEPLKAYQTKVTPYLERQKLKDSHIMYILCKMETIYEEQIKTEKANEDDHKSTTENE